ncbi:FeS cluster assembly scaffold IscU [Caldimicrobium thiodismutans]|uniref:FeS cluster assembly scaffold IscU n=1 Tax=Caldimicrobium thiodismutans TaxID=1653476 RepID=A0A0U5AWW9_9BACT|nr:iron-sulfur cluster assembly scaffold protein [Caldimicrobium thiodismutans]BAU23896.1 FeS cluster assembly scaffold IscU [Caldimicrobium thiodismutans]
MAKYYGKKVLQEFLNPKNIGEIPDADIIITEENPVCTADSPPSPCLLRLYLKREGNIIKDAKFKVQGCVAAIAFLSKLTEKLKGKTIDEILKLERDFLLEELESGIPENKLSCPILNVDTLKKALLSQKIS